MAIVNNVKSRKIFRKRLRNCATWAEKRLWQEIKHSELGYKFRRQHGVNNFVLDFYCPKLKLAIELDGEVHNFYGRKQRDYERDKKINRLGVYVIRIKNDEVYNDIEKVLKKIKDLCDTMSGKIK
jgi:very-short-patch-repair endonuclease